MKSVRSPFWLGLIVVMVAWWVASPAIRLPNIYDTLLHTQLAEDLTLTSVWLPDDRFGFYRPLVFLPFVLMQDLIGGTPAWLLQTFNIAQHTLNATLVYKLWLRERGSQSRFGPAVVGLLFAGYPFAYQAIAIYGNNAYLTVTGLILLGLVLRRDMLKLAVVQLIAFLVHETGVLLMPLVGLFWLADQAAAGFKPGWIAFKSWRRYLLPLAVWLIYLAIYLALPQGGGPTLNYGGNDPWVKFLLFAQNLSYPFGGLAGLVPSLPAVTVVFIALGLTVILAIPAVHADLFPLIIGLIWWLLASAVIAVTLPTYYIADGARLLYPGAAGLAILWGGLWYGPLKRTGWGWFTVALIVSLMSGRFVHRMLGYYALGSEPVEPIVERLNTDPAEHLIWVNPPQWVSPPRNVYPIGTEFAPILGDHLFAVELLRANGVTDLPERIDILHVPDRLSQTEYNYGLYRVGLNSSADLGESTVVFESRITPTGIQTTEIGRSGTDDRQLAQIGPFFLTEATAIGCVDHTTATFGLTAAEPVPDSLVFFVQLFDESMNLLAQSDGPPFSLPPGQVIVGDRPFVDQRLLPLDTENAPKRLFFGAYDRLTGERYAAVDSTGTPLNDQAVVIELICD